MKDSLLSHGQRLAVAALLFSHALAPAKEAAPAAEVPKTYVLFMGADIEVQVDRKPRRVQNVEGSAYVVGYEDRLLNVPMNKGALDMRVTRELKLSGQTAQFAALKVERAYTPPNDPNIKWAGASAGSAAASLVGTRAGQMASAMMGAQLSDQRAANLGGGQASLSGGSATTQIQAFNQATREATADLNSVGYTTQQLLAELELKNFDAALVTCEVSAERPVQNPYIVVVTQYREKGDLNGPTKSRIFAGALERLDEHPVKFRILQGGFPPGYELVRSDVHLYDAGRELGTNVADKNVWLTRDEAHQYTVLDHVGTHKGLTLPPALAFGVNSWDVEPHYSPEQVAGILYVKVTKDGLPKGAFRDEKCTQSSGDAYLDDLVARTRFKPALLAGKAVDGVAKLKIADLAPGP